MTIIPLEVYEIIISHMALGDAARIARCCRSMYDAVCRHLYKRATLRFTSGTPTTATKLLLQQLSKRSDLRRCVRHVSLSNRASTVWTSGHSTLIGLLLSVVLEFPDRIRTFHWDAGGVPTSTTFQNLESLQCTKIRGDAEIRWAQRHLAGCRGLTALRLGLVLPPPGVGSYLLSSVRARHLQVVSLQRIDLTGVVPAKLLSVAIRALELRHCPGSEAFLVQACRANLAQQLEDLVLVGNTAVWAVMEFVSHLGPALRRLALCIGSVGQRPCMQCVTPKSPSLRSLVLDFRVSIRSAAGSWMYSTADFAWLVRAYPKLETLGLPVDLRDTTKRVYTRVKLPV